MYVPFSIVSWTQYYIIYLIPIWIVVNVSLPRQYQSLRKWARCPSSDSFHSLQAALQTEHRVHKSERLGRPFRFFEAWAMQSSSWTCSRLIVVSQLHGTSACDCGRLIGVVHHYIYPRAVLVYLDRHSLHGNIFVFLRHVASNILHLDFTDASFMKNCIKMC